MASSLTDKFRKGVGFFQTTLSGSVTASDTSFSVASTTGWPTDCAIDIIIDRIDQNGDLLDPSLREVMTVTISGTTLTTDATRRGLDNTTAQSHLAGAVVEVNFTADTWNDHIDGILVAHNQDGTIKNDAVDTAQIADSAVETASIADSAVTAAKIATLPVKRQDNTTNSDTSVKVLSGWGYIQSLNGTTGLSKTVTFGVTFATPPVVVVTNIGLLNGSNPDSIDDFNSYSAQFTAANAITTTGFNARIQDVVSSANNRFGFSWIAIGVVA